MKQTLLNSLAAMAMAMTFAAPHAFAQDVEAGKKAFNKCKSCHEVEQAKNKVGPNLVGIIGRKSGSVSDFNYSDAMKNAGVTWDEKTIAEYIKKPKEFIKGNKMTFAGLQNEDEINNLIAYLKTVQPK